MFAGHIGVALAVGSKQRQINLGLFAAAALLLDFVLWLFILLGWESVRIPTDFARSHQPEFVFPYSHGLLAALLWSGIAAALVYSTYAPLKRAGFRAAAVLAGAVFSHWILDYVVHRPELSLAGTASRVVGLGLWDHLAVALGLESAILLFGVFLFVSGTKLPKGRAIGIAVICLLILLFTVVGMTLAPPPPSAFAMASSSLVTVVVVCLIIGWLGRLPKASQD